MSGSIPPLPSRYQLWPSPEAAHLGSGGAASVWRVRDQALGEEVALKVLNEDSQRFQVRLEREAVLASRIVHPNVIALHDVGRTPDGRSYMAFPLANEGTMLEYARTLPPWPEFLSLIIQMLQGLAAMHARDILHLDVKLSNLLLHRSRHEQLALWLADLGVARALTGEDDHDKRVVGTLSYMASERLSGQHQRWCPATDLFAVGAVIYRLLTGVLPFPANNPKDGMNERLQPPSTIPVRPWLRVPRGIDDVILPMLQFDPTDRYDLAGDAIRAFQALPPVQQEAYAPPSLSLERQVVAPLLPIIRGDSATAKEGQTRQPTARPRASFPANALPSQRPTTIPQTPSLMVHREIALVARESAMTELWAAARECVEKRRPLVIEVQGPAGVGRTRLIEEFTRTLEELGLGEGVRMEHSAADGPTTGLRGAWRRIVPPGSDHSRYVHEITRLLARDRGLAPEKCRRDAEALAHWLAPAPGVAPRTNRSEMREMLVEHLERRSWRGLSWLWVEDANRAGENEDCWTVVDQLLGRAAPVIVLIATRPEPLSPSMLELRALHPGSIRRIRLEPLRKEQAIDLVQTHLPMPDALADEVCRAADGNPRAIHQLLAWWIRTGMLKESEDQRHGRAWTLRDDAPPTPPDPHAFATARLASLQDASVLEALQFLALSGAGTTENVLRRVAPDGFDLAVVDGIINVFSGRPAPEFPELIDAALARLSPAQLRDMHTKLGAAWTDEGDDPATLARIGHHRQAGGNPMGALRPLDLALEGLRASLSVAEAIRLSADTMACAEALGHKAEQHWARAAMVQADALWRAGDEAGANQIDRKIARVRLPSPTRTTAICAAIRRAGPASAAAALDRLSNLEGLLADLPNSVRADVWTTSAQVRAWTLDTEGALADLHEALACRPEPETACRARLLRARLLATTDPMVGWHEILRTVEIATGNGLLRYQILAWGLAGEAMALLERGDEIIERLRSGVGRLIAHGEVKAAKEVRQHLGLVLRALNRPGDAQRLFSGVAGNTLPSFGTITLSAHTHAAVLSAIRADGEALFESAPSTSSNIADAVAWELMMPLASLLEGELPAAPSSEAIERSVHLGAEGLFLARAIATLYAENGSSEMANSVGRQISEASLHAGLSGGEGDGLLERMNASRRSSP